MKKTLDDVDLQIVRLLAKGNSIKEIGKLVFRSPRTVENRVQGLKKAFGARNITHLVMVIYTEV